MAQDDLKVFPPPEKGMTRHVLTLPAKEDETLFKVEILVGKTVRTDSINQFFFTGKVESATVEGWGYTYLLARAFGEKAGTRMAAPPGSPEVERFITLGGEPHLVRYNSKLPVVIYVPEGGEVRFRIWRVESGTQPVPEG